MDESYKLNGINFIWDRDKARKNFGKHRILFESAAEAFLIRLSGLSMPAPKKRLVMPLSAWTPDGACCSSCILLPKTNGSELSPQERQRG